MEWLTGIKKEGSTGKKSRFLNRGVAGRIGGVFASIAAAIGIYKYATHEEKSRFIPKSTTGKLAAATAVAVPLGIAGWFGYNKWFGNEDETSSYEGSSSTDNGVQGTTTSGSKKKSNGKNNQKKKKGKNKDTPFYK